MPTADDSDDEPLALSSHALAALAEFRAEKDSDEKQFQKVKAGGGLDDAGGDQDGTTARLSMAAFSEDWGKSQFWHSEETAHLLANELIHGAAEDETIAVVSCPSVFVAIKNILNTYEASRPKPTVFLLEFDERFNVFPEFVPYDYRQPMKLPGDLKSRIDRFIIDPPFLNEDCQTKTAITARWLAKPNTGRTMVCTGERMKCIIGKLYKEFGVRMTTYEPKHARELGNEFFCYANFECGEWKWRTEQGEDADEKD